MGGPLRVVKWYAQIVGISVLLIAWCCLPFVTSRMAWLVTVFIGGMSGFAIYLWGRQPWND